MLAFNGLSTAAKRPVFQASTRSLMVTVRHISPQQFDKLLMCIIVIPIPTVFWHVDHKNWLLPLYFIFSGAWALEMYVRRTGYIIDRC